MTDTPPDAFAMSGAEAGAALAKMTAEFRGAPPSDKPTTPAKAQSRLNQLTADKAWADRLAKGDVAARREFTELTAQVANSAGPLGGTELEVVDSISDPNRMPKERYDGLLEGLREQGMPESGEKYVRDLDSGVRADRPTAGDGAACKLALDRLTRDPEWARKVLANDPSRQRIADQARRHDRARGRRWQASDARGCEMARRSGVVPMNAIVENFAAELRADPRYSIHADAFLRGYREGEAQAVLNRETRKYLSAVLWILAEPGRGLDEKIEALMKLNGLPRCHVLIPSMRKFVGWDGDPH